MTKLLTRSQLVLALAEGYVFIDSVPDDLCEMVRCDISALTHTCYGKVYRRLFKKMGVERTLILTPGCAPSFVFHAKGHYGVAHHAIELKYINRADVIVTDVVLP